MIRAILPLDGVWLDAAAQVHSASWQESHQAICSEAFVAAHTPARQRAYLQEQIAQGKRFFVLVQGDECLGLISVCQGLIENLYVNPAHYRQGIGTALLNYACSLCKHPVLWVLSSNERAIALYEKRGFGFTGKEKQLKGTLKELEMKLNEPGEYNEHPYDDDR